MLKKPHSWAKRGQLRRLRRSPLSDSQMQRGVALIEGLIAILIFAVGLIGTLKVQADSVSRSRDALYRAEAGVLAHEIIGIMWTDRANLAAYAHRPTGTDCQPTGTNTANANASRWLGEFTTAANGRYLPGATLSNQQIIVSADTPPKVTVRICWRAPQDTADSNFVAVSQLPL
jgi:type IV pilus assembly protein PilV